MTTAIRKEFRSLTPAERVEFIGELWNELAETPDSIPVPSWQLDELDRRRELYQKDPSRAVPWGQVKAEIIKRHAKRRRPA
jgi:putative addiction module component (TIGR02574 family)